jgi:Ca2+-transporting ATPase
MVTGDHPTTASAVARQIGVASPRVVTGDQLRRLSPDARASELASTDVVARATAEDKLVIVEALQRNGEVLAMTGDGINDAPALKRADIGIAMGRRGSDVAREVSDVVLLDDDFSTIVRAIEEGRNIYENIQKFIRFTFSTNVALALIVLGGAAGSYWMGLREHAGTLVLPLSAVQILFINFVGDGPPALALAIDRSASAMVRHPRPPQSRLLDAVALRFILLVGCLQAAVGLGLLVMLPRFGFEIAAIQSLVFLYESSAKVLFVYPARRVSGAPASNRLLHASTALGLGLTVACVLVPSLRAILGLLVPTAPGVIVVASCLLVTWLLVTRFVAAQRGVIDSNSP